MWYKENNTMTHHDLPIFKPQDKIRFRNKVAYVIECVNEDSAVDVRNQGYRYYVDSAGIRWSVSEEYLLKNNPHFVNA